MFFDTKKLLTRTLLIPLLLILALGPGLLYTFDSSNAQGDEIQENIENEINSINGQIESVRIQLDGVQEERKSLEATLADLRGQISALRAQIEATKAEIARLEDEIAKKQQEIDDQKVLLTDAFRALYKRSDASAFELIVASENFGEYLDSQEYLDRLKSGIAESVTRIQELKVQLEAEEAEQEALLSQQEGQEVSLVAIEAEQQRILDQTRGQEELFQQQLDDLEAEQLEKEKELEAYLASLISSAVSLGPVIEGEVIGKMGNTGWSTGPHLHLQIYSGPGSYLEPLSTINNFGWSWPVSGGGGWVSQGYHSGHRAVDIAGTEGTPLVAIASGNIIHRGCLYVGSNYATFGVIIDHGNYYSSYIHMQAPNNSKYSACNINRRVGGYYYGQPSIDYSTTE